MTNLSADTSNVALRPSILAYRNSPYKNPVLAGSLAIVPGLGFAYLGMWQSAVTTFVLTAVSVWATSDFKQHDMPGAAVAAGSIASVFYVGGILSSVKSATDYNVKVSADARNEIRNILLPELSFEF